MKDPIAYQAVVAMETTSLNSNPEDKYYAQDDASEAARRDSLADGTDNPWYDANIHGDFSEDGS